MTKEQWINVALKLAAQSRRTQTGWERDFTEAEIKALRKEWNQNTYDGDTDYWRD